MRYLPNLLTCSRIVLTPYLVYLLMSGDCATAFVWSCLAGATDGLDGFLARRWGVSTRMGAYLDPIADKFLLTTLYICFGISRLAPWWLTWLVVGRDALILIMTAWAMLTTSYRDFPPTFWGKLSTAIQIAAVLAILGACAFGIADLWLDAAVRVTAFVTVTSGIQYVIRAVLWRRRIV